MALQIADADHLTRLVANELAVDRGHAYVQSREAARHSGVAWSGMAGEPLPQRSPVDAEVAAKAKLDDLKVWRASLYGRLLEAVAESQRAAVRAHAAGETARAAVSRGTEADLTHYIAAASEMAHQALAASRAARRALRVARTSPPR